MDLLLLHPPAAKPAEPPLGIAVLLGHLRRLGFAADGLDLNLAASRWLLEPDRLTAAAGPAPSTALRRAVAHVPRALALLCSPRAVESFARYRSAVEDLNRALGVHGQDGERLTLGDYLHGHLSPFAPADLGRLAAGSERTLFRDFFEAMAVPEVLARRPRRIGLSINYRHQVLPAFELAGLLRRALPETELIAGGGLVSSWAAVLEKEGRRLPPFDRLVTGPGEAGLVGLLRGEVPASLLPGDPGGVEFVPDYSFADLTAYFSPEPVLPLATSRGCYWSRCRFCPEATAPVQPFAAHPPAAVPQLLRSLAASSGVRRFHLTDNALPPATLQALAAAPGELAGLAWHGFVRFERALADPALVSGLAAAGCRMLQLGLESGSQAVLDGLRKGTDLRTAARILGLLHEAGIATYVYVLLGTPGETPEDASRTRAFLEEHAGAIDFLNLAIMNLPRASDFPGDLPGAEWEEEPLGLYRQQAGDGERRATARRFLSGELLATPAIRAIVHRTPPWFTSNHAPFFVRPGRL